MRGSQIWHGQTWNPWHGCDKYSEGCENCYVYRRDEAVGRDASVVSKTKNFALPLQKNRKGEYKIPSGTLLYCCLTSDFFIDKADAWRPELWDIMRIRSDLRFMIITKRIERFLNCIPADWGDGWDNVAITCTMENQRVCDIRFPIFASAPIKHKYIACEPLLGPVDMRRYLTDEIELLIAGGESGPGARPCDYRWILDLREQCIDAGVSFRFKQTGANFIKDGRIYRIARKFQHSQARKADIDT